MKKSTSISLFFLILLILLSILSVVYKYQQRLDAYRYSTRASISIIHEALLSYYDIYKRLPNKLNDLLKAEHRLVCKDTLKTQVNDDFSFFSESEEEKYYSPFLYDTKLKDTYKNSSPNTIIIASPRFNNKRFVILLKDVIGYKPDKYEYYKVIGENDFLKQAKIQNWKIKPQKRLDSGD